MPISHPCQELIRTDMIIIGWKCTCAGLGAKFNLFLQNVIETLRAKLVYGYLAIALKILDTNFFFHEDYVCAQFQNLIRLSFLGACHYLYLMD